MDPLGTLSARLVSSVLALVVAPIFMIGSTAGVLPFALSAELGLGL
ncbi:hypothetical protein [Rhodococcus spongiicola]|nr:hypothetical protein [Rhodococcus spongiicola]